MQQVIRAGGELVILLAKSENGRHAQTSTSWRPFPLVTYSLKRVKIRISRGVPGFASKILSSDRVHGAGSVKSQAERVLGTLGTRKRRALVGRERRC